MFPLSYYGFNHASERGTGNVNNSLRASAPGKANLLSVPLLQLIADRLSDHKPGRIVLRRLMKRSAVAMILQVYEGELRILMIKRALREGDPWSGHMAFPGGRMDKSDANGIAVAVRETSEEVGLKLNPDRECIGRLSDLNARPRKGTFGMAISPFVFRLDREVEFNPNYEVAETVWVPLEFLMDADNLQETQWDYQGVKITVPCYMYEGRQIWGLSLMMLGELLDLIEGRRIRRPLWRRHLVRRRMR